MPRALLLDGAAYSDLTLFYVVIGGQWERSLFGLIGHGIASVMVGSDWRVVGAARKDDAGAFRDRASARRRALMKSRLSTTALVSFARLTSDPERGR